MLILRSYSAGYKSPVFAPVDLECNGSKVILVTGDNGVGKSTLLKGIMGLAPIEQGDLLWEGNCLKGIPSHKRVKMGFAYLSQSSGVFESISVRENILLGWMLGGRRKSTFGIFASEITRRFPWMDTKWKALGGHLSGGERRIVGFARVIASNAKLLLLDEPLAGVALINRSKCIAWVKEYSAEKGAITIWVEHSAPEVLESSDAVLQVYQGTPSEDPVDTVL